MSEYYDHYHRWEPLAEFHFNLDSDDSDEDDENYLYCLCSRAFIRDGIRTYYVDKEDGSESDMEVYRDSQSQEWEDQSHVHFSLDTSYKVKCEKDEGASCYCSASHTDNCCSTDEHDAAQMHGISHALQPSDSGADLTYQDCHSDYTTHDKLERMDQDFPITTETNEDYLSEVTWEKFWAINGERLIWASWIKKYSDYINPTYLDENNDLLMDENNIPKQRSVDQIFSENNQKNDDDSIRERKFSYDSKVNPYKKSSNQNEKQYKNETKDETWLPITRRRSCSEHERIVSPRTFAGTDSMTNVTKMTLSSYDVTSSHVTSESTPTDDYSVSSSTSDDQSNDQTRIANVDNMDQTGEMDTEQYWQYLWKKHFGEQYALHYANYTESHAALNAELPAINIENIKQEKEKVEETPQEVKKEEKALEIECENSEGNSQELPTVIEVQAKVEEITITEETAPKPRKRGKKHNNRYLDSVGVLLQSLLKEEQSKQNEEVQSIDNEKVADGNVTEVLEAGDTDNKKEREEQVAQTDNKSEENKNIDSSVINNNFNNYIYDDGDDDPPEDTPIHLKRSHEIEIDHEEKNNEKIKSTFSIMGFCIEDKKLPKGEMVYRKKFSKLRAPRYKRLGVPRKTYFDDDGNPIQEQQKDPQDDKEMQTGEDGPDAQPVLDTQIDKSKESENDASNSITCSVENKSESSVNNDPDRLLEASAIPLPSDLDQSFSDNELKTLENTAQNTETSKRRRRQKKKKTETEDSTEIPEELRDDPKMMKYWKRRHSLFHRFDSGVQLDRESWFSVTPEAVARHTAHKYRYNTVVDGFCGVGGNTIQFARVVDKVIAIDIDPCKIEMARHNAAVYGVADRVEFVVGDFFELAPTLSADMVFLSPPWGGPSYSNNAQYDLETMLLPKPASELMSVARMISTNITLYLPRNSRPDQILSLAKDVSGSVEIEQNYLDKRYIAITAYFY